MITEREKELLAILAVLDEIDFMRADATWNRLAPKGFRGLLSARPAIPSIAPAGKFWWDPGRAQFGLGTRGYVSPLAIRKAINSFNDAHAKELAALALATVGGKGIAVTQFEAGMERGVKTAQIVNHAVGRGGIDALTSTDMEAVEGEVEYQFGRVQRFAEAIDSESVQEAAAARRASAYARSAVSGYDGMRRRAAEIAGFTLERNILGAAEHCLARPKDVRPDCPSLSAKGWVPVGTIAPIGTRLCLWNCRCHMVFKRGA